MKFPAARLLRKRRKVFVVGLNKTGTTSLAAALRELGWKVGKQEEAELMMEDWAAGNVAPIVDHCRTADAFQDIPFALPGAYRELDRLFPGSRFILTVRENARAWHESLTRFHTKIVGKGRLPTPDDLKEFGYRAPGWTWRAQQLAFGIDESNLYDPDHYLALYDAHQRDVMSHFEGRPDDLLVLNVADPDAAARLCRFLGAKERLQEMPHLNPSR